MLTSEQLAYQKAWRKEHPPSREQKDARNAYARAWLSKNKEHVSAYRKARYEQKTPAQRLQPRKARNDNLRKFIWDIKLASGCVDCGYKSNPVALQFDHLPQFEKLFPIGARLASKGKESLLAEINKCEVRCANCHAIKTYARYKEA